MKKNLFILTLFSLLGLMPSLAQNRNVLSVPDFTVANTQSIVLPIDLENTSNIVAVQFTMQVPSGVSINTSTARLNAARKVDHNITFRSMGGNKYMCMINSIRNSVFSGQDGTLMTVSLTKSSTQESFSCPVTLSDVVIATADGANVMTDSQSGTITFKLLNGQTVCGNAETAVEDFYQLSSLFDYNWSLKEIPNSVEGYTESGRTAIPPMTLTNEGIGTEALTYTVNATYGGIAIYSFEYSISVRPALLGAFFNVTPRNQECTSSNAVNLTWNNILNAVYDVYIWKTGEDQPNSPVASNLTTTQYSANTHCTNGETYNWRVVAHNECQEIVSDVYSFGVRDLPDLHVTAVRCSDPVAGQDMTVEWVVKNEGAGSTEDVEWNDYIWLVPDIKLGTATTGSKLMKTVSNVKALDAGESYNNSYEVALDERIYGDYYIVVTSDMYNVTDIDWPTETPAATYNPSATGYLTAKTTASYVKVSEPTAGGRKDNFFYTKINISVPPLPDLQIPKIEVFKDGVPVTEVFGGSTVEVVVTIQNKGEVAITNKTVSNVLYRSDKEYHEDAPLTTITTSSKTLNLIKDASYEERYTVTIPSRYSGDLYFHAYTDQRDVVYELANTENNWGTSGKISVLVAPGADLQPTSISTKATQVVANQAITISYTVENLGAGQPDVSQWNDKVYLCQNVDGLTDQKVLLATVPVTYSSDKYSKDVNVKLGSLAGTYYIYIVTDADDKVFEYEGEENNIMRSDNSITFVSPDLTVELTKIYADIIKSNEEVSFEWKVKNVGAGDMQNVKVTDAFYASSSETGANARYLGSVSNDLWIAAGSEKVLKGTLTIPYGNALDATQYIFVKTDTENLVKEESENNNISNMVSRQCHFSPKPTPVVNYADLSVTNANAPETAQTSTYQVLNWTCINNGQTAAGAFTAAVYLSDDDRWSSDDIQISSQRVASLAVGASTDLQADIYLKDEYVNKKFFIFVVDSGSAVEERDESNNAFAKAIAMTQAPSASYKLPDVSISFAKVPETVSSSEYFTVNWTCSNIGSGNAGAFTNGIYLSDDETWSPNDKLLTTQRTASLKQEDKTDYQTHLCIANEHVGQKYIIFRADKDNVLEEETKANNTMAVKITIVAGSAPVPAEPGADLTITALSTTPSGTIVTSSDFTVNWTIANTGTANATSSMVGVYLSDNVTLSDDDTLLATQFIALLQGGSSIDYQTSLNIPDLSAGNKYIIVCADIDNTVNENSEANNSKVIAVNFRKRNVVSRPDLIATVVSVPSSTTAVTDFTATWKVSNSGTVDTSAFMSAVYLSSDASWSSDDELLVSRIVQSLPAGENTEFTFTLNIAQKHTGDKYLIFLTDVYNSITESNKENNYVVKAISVANSPSTRTYADLAVETTTVPDDLSTSEEFTVNWTVVNKGTADAGSFVSAVYLSEDANYSNDDVLLGSERTSSLKTNGTIEHKTLLTIADKYNGNKYLIFRANAYGSVFEQNISNNYMAVPVTIACSPLPDLKVQSLKCESEFTAGQEVELTFTIANIGEAATHQSRWVTEFYLSQSATFNKSNAAKIGSSAHSGMLNAGDAYTETATITLPQDLSGNYLIYAYVDALDAVYESNETNNASKGIVVQIYPVEERPVDLSIDKLDAPLSITAGESFTLAYRITNNGEYAANGTLRDVIYLSNDENWDYNDIQIGVVTGKVNIPAGQNIIREATGRVVNVPEGKYYFIVKTNSTRSIPEVSEEDNVSVNSLLSEVKFKTLQLGAAENVNTCGYYKVDVDATSNSQTVAFTLTHPEDLSAGLYIRYESVPSTAKYDYASTALSTDEQMVILPVTTAGRYYILAQDNSSLVNNDGYVFSLNGGIEWQGADMTLTAERINFGATALSVMEGGTDGWITTEIRGALFDSIMDFRLAAEKNVIPVEHLVYHNQTSSSATFNLRHAEVGIYDIISELPNGTRATLPDGFHVIPGVQCELGIKIDAPRVVHSGSYSPVSIAYANGGTNDIQIKGILVKMQGAYLGKTVSDFKNASTELYLVPEGFEPDRFGYISIPPGTQKVINFFMEQHAGTSHMQVYIIK